MGHIQHFRSLAQNLATSSMGSFHTIHGHPPRILDCFGLSGTNSENTAETRATFFADHEQLPFRTFMAFQFQKNLSCRKENLKEVEKQAV